jgi:hypothetical protein
MEALSRLALLALILLAASLVVLSFSRDVFSQQYDQPPPSSTPQPSPKSGCLIATAAFGSELTPPVQFLREFRDQRILGTASGSSFMNVFNAWYYSFSPAVADFERQQPWLQQTVRIAIYPLVAILHVAEGAYGILPGEYGSMAAGMVASSLIGVVYAAPMILSVKQVRRFKLDYRVALVIVGIAASSVLISLATANEIALMVATSVLVLSTLLITAILSANTIVGIIEKRKRK